MSLMCMSPMWMWYAPSVPFLRGATSHGVTSAVAYCMGPVLQGTGVPLGGGVGVVDLAKHPPPPPKYPGGGYCRSGISGVLRGEVLVGGG